jgi:hypothetical protein
MGKEQALCLHSGAKRRARGSKKPISVLKATANRQSVVITTSMADLSLSLQTPRDNKKISNAFQSLLSNGETPNDITKASAILHAPTLAAMAVHIVPLPKQEQGHGELVTQPASQPIKQSYLDLEAS